MSRAVSSTRRRSGRRPRRLAAGAVLAGLAVLATGCGVDGMGAEPPSPGLAAQVEDETLSLDDVDLLTDAVCVSSEADPTSRASSRAIVQTGVVAQWVTATAAAELAAERDLDVRVPAPDYTTIPGWDEFTEEQQEVVREYIDGLQLLEAAGQELAEDGELDISGVDVTINPRYDLDVGTAIEPADRQLSVPVSGEALDGTADELSDEQLVALPAAQLCGRRPDPTQVQQPPIPGM